MLVKVLFLKLCTKIQKEITANSSWLESKMERSESEEIKRIDTITQEISPTFCFAKWYHANIYFQTGETHSCYHPAPHKIDTAPLLENPSAIHNTAQKKQERAAMMRGDQPAGC